MSDDALRAAAKEMVQAYIDAEAGNEFNGRMEAAHNALRAALASSRPEPGLVLVRADSGGVFPDGTTNTPAIDFDAALASSRPEPLDVDEGRYHADSCPAFDHPNDKTAPACDCGAERALASSRPEPLDAQRLTNALNVVLRTQPSLVCAGFVYGETGAAIAREYDRLGDEG